MSIELKFGPKETVVSDVDPKYIEDRAKLKADATTHASPFGHDLFRASFLGSTAVVRGRLLSVLKNAKFAGASAVRSLFVDALASSEVRQHSFVQKVTRGTPGDPNTPAVMLAALEEGEFPADLIFLILKAHIKRFRNIQAEAMEMLPAMQKRFESNIAKLLENPQHALSSEMLPAEFIKRRLSEVGVIIVDPLELFDITSSGTIGEYDSGRNTASLIYDPAFSPKRLQYHNYIYGHEMWHVLSGRTITKDGHKFVHKRIGVEQSKRFTWLDESITETLNQDAETGKRNYTYGSYTSERSIYRQLLRRIPEDFFLWAYFENTSPENQSNKHWQALVAEIEKVYGEGFLDKLDYEINAFGVKAAEQKFEL